MAAVPAPYLRKALEGAEAYPAEADPQTSGITTAILLSYVESRGGRAAVQRVLELSGLLGRESELRDESTWWTYIQKQALMEAVTHVLEDPHATRRAGAYALQTGVGSTLKAALRAFGSPELAYTNVARSNQKVSRNSRMEVLMVGNGCATLSHHQVVDVRNTKVDCLYNQGLLGVLPELFGLAPARVTHTQCALDGADSCIYDVRWERRSRMARWSPTVTAAGVLVGGAGAATALAPASVSGAALALAGAAAWAGSATAAARRRLTEVESELDNRVRSAESLRNSLGQLAGELDPDRLMTLIADGGRKAVGADAAVLALEENGALAVQRASGLGAAAQRALTDWFASTPASGEGIQVIGELDNTPPLAPVLKGPPPLTSLCSAPLAGLAGSRGMLVLLSRTSDLFPPNRPTGSRPMRRRRAWP